MGSYGTRSVTYLTCCSRPSGASSPTTSPRLRPTITPTGRVFRNNNDYDISDHTKPGIAGVLRTLTGTDVNVATVNRATTIAADGTYSFTGLLGGTYTLTESQSAGSQGGQNRAGTIGGTVTYDTVSAIAVLAGTSANAYTFGEGPVVTVTTFVHGIVFIDANSHGVPAMNEVGLPGVTVTLFELSGNIVGTATPAADSAYNIPTLPPGANQLAQATTGAGLRKYLYP